MTGCWSEGGGATGGGTGGEDGGLVPGTVAAGPGFYAGAGSDSYMTVHFEEASMEKMNDIIQTFQPNNFMP